MSHECVLLMNMNCDSVGGMSGWCTRESGRRQTGSVRPPNQLPVAHSTAAVYHFPLPLFFSRAGISWKNSWRGFGENVIMNFDQDPFVVVLYLSQKSFLGKCCLLRRSMTWEKKNAYTYIGIFPTEREQPNPGDCLDWDSMLFVPIVLSACYSSHSRSKIVH